MTRPRDQESVWDYPRPPAVQRSNRRVRVVVDAATVVDTRDAVRVLETSHPPTWYIPATAFTSVTLEPTARRTVCEFKGEATYFDLVTPQRRLSEVAWGYAAPRPGYELLAGLVAVYPDRVDCCIVDDEIVQPQDGRFYGGWITSEIVGPFKGGPGTIGW